MSRLRAGASQPAAAHRGLKARCVHRRHSVAQTPSPADPLAPLTEATLRSIAASGVVRSYPRNVVLINEGDRGEALFIVVSGKVKEIGRAHV